MNENKKRGVERYFELSISNINYVYRIMQLCSTLFCVSVLECKWFLLKNVSINKSDFSFEINSLGRSSIDYFIILFVLSYSTCSTHHLRKHITTVSGVWCETRHTYTRIEWCRLCRKRKRVSQVALQYSKEHFNHTVHLHWNRTKF